MATVRVLHVSDLHVGKHEVPEVVEPLARLVERLAPDLVIASGDLTHRGRRDQHERAAAFLRALGPPVLAVPGNHDIPYTFPARFTRSFHEFERLWETVEPVWSSETIHVVGLNSVRPWRQQSGRVRAAQLERAATLLAEAPADALRVVALHHQLVGAPWRTRKKPVAHRNVVLASLVDAGAELIVGGHIHQAVVAGRHDFEASVGGERAVTVTTAPGFGQPRPHRRGEARGLHVYEASERSLGIRTYVWRGDDWGLTAVRRFARGREPLAVEPS